MAWIQLPDRSVWGYGRFGRRGGKPVLVHHGLIGDANLGPAWAPLGEALGLEWIVVARPGYGRTSPRRMDRVADWPGLIEPVLHALGINRRFDTVGISAGAPYAYALAAGMPERIGRICILSGVPFIGAAGVLAAYPEDGQAAYGRYASSDESAMRAEFRAFCEGIAARLSDNEQLSAALAPILANDAAGPAREARLQARGWGFGREAVSCPVDLWHSEADDMVPYAAARLSAEGLPNAVWHVQAEPSHLASERTLADMARILARSTTPAHGSEPVS
ncbi:MAG: alpha/beta hydrolase [Pseudomonadota bacterium]